MPTQTAPGCATKTNRKCCDVHCNNLWSIWYGLLALGFQAFIVYKAVTLFLIYIALPWPDGEQPYLELNIYVGLVGAGVVLLPFFFIAFLFKIGNLANDGYKLGYHLSACAMDPPSILARSSGVIRNAWHHGGPTAPFIHLVSAFCFVLPKIFIEAKLIDVGFLAKDHIWKTDLDWLLPHQDRLVILQFLTGGSVNASLATTTTIAPYHHPAAQIRDYLEKQDLWWPISPEYLNYILALIVYSVRYPAVFWNTNKGFAFLFSIQLFASGIQSLMSVGAISVMYKVQILGPQNVLHKYEPFLLNPSVCMLIYIISCVIVTVSSCVVYMYGYHKFMTFVETERDKHSIRLREGYTSLWSYFPHCSAMCVLIALSVCNAPLLYDFTLIYKGSLDGAVLSHVIATILHLFLWIVIWLFLTIKQKWQFKLRVTIGRSVVKTARSIKLLNDVDLTNEQHNDNQNADNVDSFENEAMMIVAFGKSFTVSEPGPKKMIMNTLTRAAIERDKTLEDENCDGQEIAQEERKRLLSTQATPIEQRAKTTKMVQVEVESPRSETNISRVDESVKETKSMSPRPIMSESNEDCDDLPPPPGHNEIPMTTSPKNNVASNIGRKTSQILVMQNHEVQDVQTPRSNRSVDSGLPHDDITPRSDSLSTASSSSPPDHQSHQHHHQQQHLQQMSLKEQHRKSTSLDDIHVPLGPQTPQLQHQNQANPQQWKSASLQRGVGNPTIPSTGIYGTVGGRASAEPPEGTMAIRPKSTRPAAAHADDEDPYGRCLNMRQLSSFSDAGNPNPTVKDPRIIDLNFTSTPSSTSVSVASTPRQGSPVQHHFQPHPTQFNTMPTQNNANGGLASNGGIRNNPHSSSNHNTLPARVNGNAAMLPPSSPRNSYSGNIPAPTGRHFKPFDHRRMNPLAEIQENPFQQQQQHYENPQAVYGTRQNPNGFADPQPRPQSAAMAGNLIVQKTTRGVPHLPQELRHTNYSSGNQNGILQNKHLVNPQIFDHQRDSANYSLTSNESG